jgi:LuxR family maltose regulon positive regulatory protein
MMGEAVLAKITRPRLTRSHQRTDLLNLLDELRTAPLIMISGLPGAGKAALVASYADTRNIPCLWYQVDDGDEDLANFFYYLGLAARELNPFKRSNMPQPTPECLAGDSTAVTKYFSDLYQCFETPFLMVFDKYQAVSEGAALHRVMRDACTMLPVGGRIVLITSNDCPPTVACLRANRTTAIIGWQDLHLHPAKVKEVAALHGLTLPIEDAAKQLQRKVGDWAADLVLSLLKSGDD